ncbi:hypothetical protein GALL_517760 [mine drainage metagenome]|uniref:Uncharacterized protein n=1 Tax=mine drainage metagenome TaxID=410659 RepID=A0A1J5PGH1_9ZZZZ
MQLFFRGLDVRALFHQAGRQADRQIERQLQRGQLELLARFIAGEVAAKRCQQIPLQRQLFLQRRQGGFRLRQRRPLGDDRTLCRCPEFNLALQQVELLALESGQRFGGLDLPAQCRFLYHGNHDIGAQGQVRRLELEALVIGLRLQRFQLPPVEAEHIGGIGHQHLGGMKVEQVLLGIEWRLEVVRHLLPRRREIGLNPGIVGALLCVDVLLRLA